MGLMKQSRQARRDIQMEWANSSGLPLLLVLLTVVATAVILPDDVPLEYSKAENSSIPATQISLL